MNKPILLGNHFEDFISNEVSSGRYSTLSKVICAALKLLEKKGEEKEDPATALLQGEQSGFEKDFNQDIHLKELHNKFL